jgi:hypothetical protein
MKPDSRGRSLWHGVLMLGTWMLFSSSTCVSAEPSGNTDWKALAEGKISVIQTASEKGTLGLRCLLLVAGDREGLFDKLKDPGLFKAQYSNIEQLNIIRSYDNGADVEFVINAMVRELRYTVSRTYDRATDVIAWSRISGDVKDISGSWKVEDSPYPGKCLITYESFVDPGKVNVHMYVFFVTTQAQHNLEKLRTILEKKG